MLEKLFDRSFLVSLVVFFVCAIIYNVGYFGTLGGSLWYFFYVPTSFFDIIKTGLMMLFALILILMVFKPILINPVFNNRFPGGVVLLMMATLVLASNFLHFSVFANSQNRSLSLVFEVMFYMFALVCFIAIVYYFLINALPQHLLTAFFLSLIPISFVIGVIDAKVSINASYHETKSYIILKNDKVVSANVLRSFDKGMFVIMGSPSNIDFIVWDQIKGVKFKKVSGF